MITHRLGLRLNGKASHAPWRNHSVSPTPQGEGAGEAFFIGKKMITQERLKELVSYNQETGDFVWISDNGTKAKAGQEAGRINFYGYSVICIDGRTYPAHRLAWLYINGDFPRNNIDHLNGVRSDNRIVNLRDVTQQINCQNHRKQNGNKKELIGACFDKATGKFKAQIMHKGVNFHIGRFDTQEQAHMAYVETKRSIHAGSTL